MTSQPLDSIDSGRQLPRQLQIEHLQSIFENDGVSAQSVRNVLQLGTERIHQCYADGVNAGVLIRLRTELVDFVLTSMWHHSMPQLTNAQIALVAVGGYGRGELHPHSDIDLAIVLEHEPDRAQSEALSKFVTSLWDTGLQIGHSVRTLQDCTDQASSDLTIVTNLMEARLLTGSGQLFQLMQRAIAPENMWPSQQFFDAKMEEQAERREKFHGNAYKLEPNLKESSGGLRDLQTLFWVSQRQFRTRQWEDLVTQELLTADEFDALMEGLEFLWKVRYLLHRIAGRAEDRLLFDYQKDIAHEFGYTNDFRNESIEQFMQRYFRHVTTLQYLNEIILQGFGGIISGVTAATRPTQLNERFQVRNGFLEVTRGDVFDRYPPALLEVFIIYSRTEEADKLRANTVRLIRSHLHLIDDKFRRDPITNDFFMQIFRTPLKLTRCIRMMSQYGVLGAYLPAFASITGRMQYDLFHAYTVDEHTTRVIRNLRRFDLPDAVDELPHCSAIMKEIENPELLYLMGLFHDIAKGRDGDHSELGALDAASFCTSHGLDSVDSAFVSWGVRHHLVMSITAQRKDISDPEVVHEFATLVSSMRHLNHLYLLTVADIRGTNSDLWNDFKAALLRDLYEATKRVLTRGLRNPVDTDEILQLRKQAAMKNIPAELTGRATGLWESFSPGYFLQYKPHEIIRHTQSILEHDNPSMPLVSIHQSKSRGSTELMVYVRDSAGLFLLLTSTLDQLNLDIQSANITTTNSGFALDTFYVLEESGVRVDEPARMQQVSERLRSRLAEPDAQPELTKQRTPRRLKHFAIETKIEYDNSSSSDVTSVFIETADSPGILSRIARGFKAAGTPVHAAKIMTFGERIEDVFVITAAQGGQILDAKEQQRITQELLNHLPVN